MGTLGYRRGMTQSRPQTHPGCPLCWLLLADLWGRALGPSVCSGPAEVHRLKRTFFSWGTRAREPWASTGKMLGMALVCTDSVLPEVTHTVQAVLPKPQVGGFSWASGVCGLPSPTSGATNYLHPSTWMLHLQGVMGTKVVLVHKEQLWMSRYRVGWSSIVKLVPSPVPGPSPCRSLPHLSFTEPRLQVGVRCSVISQEILSQGQVQP